jgi:hypothetical protein
MPAARAGTSVPGVRKLLVGLIAVAVGFVLLVAILFGTTGGGRRTLSTVGGAQLRGGVCDEVPIEQQCHPPVSNDCEISPPLNANEIWWPSATPDAWAGAGCAPPR